MESVFSSHERMIKEIFISQKSKPEQKKGPHQLKFEKLNAKKLPITNDQIILDNDQSTNKPNTKKKKSLKEIAKNNKKLTEKFIPKIKEENEKSKCSQAEKDFVKIEIAEEENPRVEDLKIPKELQTTHQKRKTKIKIEKPPKKSKSIQEKQEIQSPPEEYFEYANLSELIKKSIISISETILMIMEVSINSRKYGLSTSNTTRKFWCNVFEKEEFKILFKNFKPETIRKYWRLIRQIPDHQKFFRIIQSNTEHLNSDQYKYFLYKIYIYVYLDY
jgi:hypothetical protein